jgi:hypothetical protein
MERKKEKRATDELVLQFLLGDDSEEAQQRACLWAYMNHAGTAYSAYLAVGRGVLCGPAPTDLDGNPLDPHALRKAITSRQGFMLPMVYSSAEDLSKSTLPSDLREMIRVNVKDYQPKNEINLLFMRADGSLGFFIGRLGQGGFMNATPEELHEAEQKGMSPVEFYTANRSKIRPKPN